MSQIQYLEQNLIFSSSYPNRIPLSHYSWRDLQSMLRDIESQDASVLAVATQLSDDASLDAIALATRERVILFRVTNRARGHVGNLHNLFQYKSRPLAAFNMARVASQINRLLKCHVEGVDLGHFFSNSESGGLSPTKLLSKHARMDVNRPAVNAIFYGTKERDVCLRAWLSAVAANHFLTDVSNAIRVDTRRLDPKELCCINQLMANIDLLDQQKPSEMQNDFTDIEMGDDGLVLRNARFKTRVRASETTSIVLDTENGHRLVGHAIHVKGKTTTIKLRRGQFRGGIQTVRVVGREEPTNAECARDGFVLRLLRGEATLTNAFIQLLWFPDRASSSLWGYPDPYNAPAFAHLDLNPSQMRVAGAMIAKIGALVIAHGPPGTGKTKTISASAQYWQRYRCPAWVIAQSNVAVKNIAESFVKHSIDFRLLVSKEFYVEWHEHIYEHIENRLIRADDLFCNPDPTGTERRLGGSIILLSTIAMLSNPALDDCRIFDFVPVERLVVDEASQIDTFEFMHLFNKFKSLKKICFFGDPKQLPPYGANTALEMKTIFDFKHLRSRALFLNTQYRMPVPLGDFISTTVYDSKLRSVHNITDPSCVAFVNVANGEEMQDGNSWINIEEVRTIVNLVRYYYKTEEFCIITPYDAQRKAIESQLQREDLPWECVYNVDSFQGHERQYILLSTVRTSSPGFLRSQQRMNVMLTRCQRGMVIVSNRHFLSTSGRNTLLGQFSRYWEQIRGAELTWTSPLSIVNRTSLLPGFAVQAQLAASTTPLPATSKANASEAFPHLRSNRAIDTADALVSGMRALSVNSGGSSPLSPIHSSPANASNSRQTWSTIAVKSFRK